MSVVGKIPFIQAVVATMTDEQKHDLVGLLDGDEGESVEVVLGETKKDDIDFGVYHCTLKQKGFSDMHGYLVHTEVRTVFLYVNQLYYNQNQRVIIRRLNLEKGTWLDVDDLMSVFELRAELGGLGGGEVLEDGDEMEF